MKLLRRLLEVPLLLESIIIVVATVALFLPTGIDTVGTAEEWRILANYDVSLTLGESFNRLRPLQTMPMLLAYLAHPDSYLAMNIILLTSFVVKSISLVMFLTVVFPNQRGAVFFAGLLFLVYPADQGLFVLRALTHHVAVSLLMLSLAGLAWYIKRGKWGFWFLFVALGVISLFIYEVGYPMMLAALPVFRTIRAPFRRIRRASLSIILVLLICSMALAVIISVIPPSIDSPVYQQDIIERDWRDYRVLLDMLASIFNMYFVHFFAGWYDGTLALFARPGLTILAMVLSVIGGGCIWLISRDDAPLHIPKPSKERWYFLYALIFMLAGYILFVPSAIRVDDWRVYLYTSGVAAGIVSYIALRVASMLQHRRVYFAVLSAILLLIAFTKTLNQHVDYDQNVDFVQSTLSDIVLALGDMQDTPALVMLDSPPANSIHIDMFYHHNSIYHALRYIYSTEDEAVIQVAEVCTDDTAFRTKSCEFEANELVVTMGPFYQNTLPYDQTIFFRYNSGQGYELLEALPDEAPQTAKNQYNPGAFINPVLPESQRLETALDLPTPQ